MPKQPAKGEAAIKKIEEKTRRKRVELFIFYIGNRIRKQIREV